MNWLAFASLVKTRPDCHVDLPPLTSVRWKLSGRGGLFFGALGDRGKPGRAKFAALRKPSTRLLPYSELGKGKAAAKGKA